MRSGVQSCLPKEALRLERYGQALEMLRALGLSLCPGTKPSIRSALLEASMWKRSRPDQQQDTCLRKRLGKKCHTHVKKRPGFLEHTRETRIRKDLGTPDGRAKCKDISPS